PSAAVSSTFRRLEVMSVRRLLSFSIRPVLCSLCLCVFVLCSNDTKAQRHQGTVPTGISFEENNGQAPSGTRFLSPGRGYTILLSRAGYDVQFRGVRLHTTLGGASTAPLIRGENVQPGRVHYLKARSSIKSVPTYGQVRYERVYPGIDLLYYGNQQQLEYD